MVLSDTDRLDAVVKLDEQVYNRFRSSHRFGKLSGAESPCHRIEWQFKGMQGCDRGWMGGVLGVFCPLKI